MSMTSADEAPVVLVVEDEALLRMVVAEALMDAGFRVIEAADGVEGLKQLRTERDVSLLITDIRMPNMGGYEISSEGLRINPQLKILLITGYSPTGIPEPLEQAGARVLQKPFDLDELCAIAQSMIGDVPPIAGHGGGNGNQPRV